MPADLHKGYYRYPIASLQKLYFLSDNALFETSLSGGSAQKVVSLPSTPRSPLLDPTGEKLFFSLPFQEGSEVFSLDLKSGDLLQLSYLSGQNLPLALSPQKDLLYLKSNANSAFHEWFDLVEFNLETHQVRTLHLGPSDELVWGPQQTLLLGRHNQDLTHWKRYRGGQKGCYWLAEHLEGPFQPFEPLSSHLQDACWAKDQLYFLSDPKERTQVYSLPYEALRSNDLHSHLIQCTQLTDFDARHLSSNGHQLFFQAGGEIYRLDPQTQKAELLEIRLRSSFLSTRPRWESLHTNLDSFDLKPSCEAGAYIARGRAFIQGNWDDQIQFLQPVQEGRCRLLRWLDTSHLVAISDHQKEESLSFFHYEKSSDSYQTSRNIPLEIGRVIHLEASPDGKLLALSTSRKQLWLYHLEESEWKLLETNSYQSPCDLSWSCDGSWLAYTFATSHLTSQIRGYHLERQKSYPLTSGEFVDFSPSFDPSGRYLVFLGQRDFEASWDDYFHQVSFHQSCRPYLLSLSRKLPPLLETFPFAPGESPIFHSDPSSDPPENAEKKPLKIDLKGCFERVFALKEEGDDYLQITSLGNELVYLIDQGDQQQLFSFDLTTREEDLWLEEANFFRVRQEEKTFLFFHPQEGLRILSSDKKEDEELQKLPYEGWQPLQQRRVEISPQKEWRQMFWEVWRLAKEHYWSPDPQGISWDEIAQRYAPLLKRVHTYCEWQDLILEMQGELQTSHTFLKPASNQATELESPVMGQLGVDLVWSDQDHAFEITKVYQGDSWRPQSSSPLAGPPHYLSSGDLLIALNHTPLTPQTPPHRLLQNLGGQKVQLTVKKKHRKTSQSIVVRTLKEGASLRYRDWVYHNRKQTSQKSRGRIGYLHIPNMIETGYSEFHRSWLSEIQKEALILDLRYNNGGFVSSMLLEKLQRKILGYEQQRWGAAIPYPPESPPPILVALVNGSTASDGDIFARAFQILNLGELVGTTTWGGVIGIWPRHPLVDRSYPTQPEYALRFHNEPSLENRGVQPDHLVPYPPHSYLKGKDPQLLRAISLIQQQLSGKRTLKPKS